MSTQTIEIESIARLDVKPGEMLVVTLPASVLRHPSEVQDIADRLKRVAPEGVEVLVISGEIKVEVVARGEQP